jgi:hypothetical protein
MTNDQLYFYNRGFNDCLAKGLYNHSIKTLTDEEIDNLIADVAEKPTDEDLYDFAKAILKKAQEK